jgi:hypothetical protein
VKGNPSLVLFLTGEVTWEGGYKKTSNSLRTIDTR